MITDLSTLPARSVLDELPGRTLTFLRGVGTSPTLRAILNQCGYSDEEHQLGWRLLHTVAGFAPGRQALGPDADPAVRAAVLELDAWDEPHFARVDAMLARRYPEQRDFVFNNLKAAQGVGAVLTVATFLGRLDALEKGEGRKASHKEDLAALALLDARGIGKAERHRLRKLVEVAQQGTEAATLPVVDDTAREAHEAALMELYLWYKDWSTSARSAIRRRDHLIRLGLAKRKARKEGGEDAGDGGVESDSAPM